MISRSFEWTQILFTALITAALSLLVSIAFFHYSSRTPELIYEQFSPSSFSNDTVQFGIYTSTLQNYGKKEAEDVQFLVQLTEGTTLQDMNIEATSPAINFNVNKNSPTSIEIFFSRLNPQEGAKFTFLLDKTDTGIETISVRGRGITGTKGPADKGWTESLFVYLISAVIAIFIGFLISFSTTRILQLNLGEVFKSQKRLADEELKIIRMKGIESLDIKSILIGNKFRLYYNPKAQKFKYMKFGDNGSILDGKNQNESKWTVKGNFLELIDEKGAVHSRFYYSPTDKAFYHTNDPDTGSITKHNIRDQYMIVEN